MNVIVLSIISSAIILDKYAFGEFGISQPLMTGTIIGALCGDIQMGILLGGMLQLVFLCGLPIGRYIPPDGQIAGIICSGSYFLLCATNPPGHALLAAVLFALVGAVIGGALDIFTRHYNDKLYRMFLKKENQLSTYHLFGLITAFLRGFCIFLPAFLIAHIITIPPHLPYLSKEFFMLVCISIGFTNAIYLFIKKSTVIYMIVGGVCGLAWIVF